MDEPQSNADLNNNISTSIYINDLSTEYISAIDSSTAYVTFHAIEWISIWESI